MCLEWWDSNIFPSCAVPPALPGIDKLLIPLLEMLQATGALSSAKRAMMGLSGVSSALRTLALDPDRSPALQLHALLWYAAERPWLTDLKCKELNFARLCRNLHSGNETCCGLQGHSAVDIRRWHQLIPLHAVCLSINVSLVILLR